MKEVTTYNCNDYGKDVKRSTMRRLVGAALSLVLGVMGLMPAPGQCATERHLRMPTTLPTPRYTAPQFMDDLLLVKTANGADVDEIREILEEVHGTVVGRVGEGGSILVIKTDKGKMAETEKKLSKDKHFAGMQRNYVYRPQQLQIGTDDPAFSQEWHLTAMHITKAWEHAVGQGQKIAIFDTGCSPVIADLKGQDKIGKGYDTLSVLYAMQNGAMMAPLDFGLSAYLATEAARNYNRGNPGDSNGHGTRVATVAAARADNQTNTAGVAPNAIIEPVLVTDPMGCTGANDATIIEGLYFAKKNKIKIVNISWGNSFTNWAAHTLLWEEIRKYHNETGGLVFLSAGNDGCRDSNLKNDYMIVVSGVDRSLKLSKSSNYGNSVYFTAPSEGILCSDQNGQTVMVDGTSFAAPIVAGVAALVWSANPGLTNKQVLEILKASCVKPEGAGSDQNGWNQYYGYGMPDAEKAVKIATGRI